MHAVQLQETENTLKETWKAELKERLDNFCRVAKNYNSALSEADQYLTSHTSKLSLITIMKTIISEWLGGLCKQANLEVENISHVKITTEHLPSSLTSFDFPRSRGFYSPDPEIKDGLSFFDAPDDLLATWVIDNFDFDALESAIAKAKREIQSIGLQHCAKGLISEFGLKNLGRYHANDIEIKQQKGRYLISFNHYGNWVHDRVRRLESLKQNALTFEKEAEVIGLSYCIQMLINSENSLSQGYDVWVTSRTKVAEDGTVSATFFKDKIKFAFEPAIFEALISFIKEYKSANTELKELVIR